VCLIALFVRGGAEGFCSRHPLEGGGLSAQSSGPRGLC